MLSTKEFIRQSLELNLFFIRIMKEHAFFLESAFTSRNSNLAERANNFKELFTKLLEKTISLSNGIISPVILQSGELVTKFTLSAEKTTSFYTRIELDTNITKSELNMKPNKPDHNISFSKDLESLVTNLNDITEESMKTTRNIRDFKAKCLVKLLNYELSSAIVPLLEDYTLRETNYYIRLLESFEKNCRFEELSH